jgi:hydroxylamine reductase (hybrid-cluster protein)
MIIDPPRKKEAGGGGFGQLVVKMIKRNILFLSAGCVTFIK